jgi:hypothetical protein
MNHSFSRPDYTADTTIWWATRTMSSGRPAPHDLIGTAPHHTKAREDVMRQFTRVAVLAASAALTLAAAGCGTSVSAKGGGSIGGGGSASAGGSPGGSAIGGSGSGSSGGSLSGSSGGSGSGSGGNASVCAAVHQILEQQGDSVPNSSQMQALADEAKAAAGEASGQVASALTTLANDLQSAASQEAGGSTADLQQVSQDIQAVNSACGSG